MGAPRLRECAASDYGAVMTEETTPEPEEGLAVAPPSLIDADERMARALPDPTR